MIFTLVRVRFLSFFSCFLFQRFHVLFVFDLWVGLSFTLGGASLACAGDCVPFILLCIRAWIFSHKVF